MYSCRGKSGGFHAGFGHERGPVRIVFPGEDIRNLRVSLPVCMAAYAFGRFFRLDNMLPVKSEVRPVFSARAGYGRHDFHDPVTSPIPGRGLCSAFLVRPRFHRPAAWRVRRKPCMWRSVAFCGNVWSAQCGKPADAQPVSTAFVFRGLPSGLRGFVLPENKKEGAVAAASFCGTCIPKLLTQT